MTILEIVKILPNSPKDVSDELLQIYVDMVTQRVLNYTNRHELPNDKLNYTIAQMVVDGYNEATGGNIIAGSGAVSSISEGGRTVSFDVGSKVASVISASVDEKIPKIKEINKFKSFYLR